MIERKPILVADRFFIDSNIALYIVEPNGSKAERVFEILDEHPVITVQVLNEFANVARKKHKLDWIEIRDGLEHLVDCCEVLPLTQGVHVRALEIAEKNLIGIYDALIVAAAELSGCDTLYTEDLNNGQRIGRVTIVNPFG